LAQAARCSLSFCRRNINQTFNQMKGPAMTTQTDRIRSLNDKLRQNLVDGTAVMTPGIAALGQEAVARIVKTIAVFDDFCHANDPYEEHDFGSFEAEGQKIFFKIDYFDRSLTYHSPDPADPTVTERVITIMLAEEY
jgi:isocitrate dehydrogenase